MPLKFIRTACDRRGLWLPSLFLAFGLLTTIIIVSQTGRIIQQEQQTQWEADSARVRDHFFLHLSRHLDTLRAYQAEFFAHPYFTEGAFKRVAHVLKIEERMPGIDAIGYVRLPNATEPSQGLVLHAVYSYGRPGESPALATHAVPEPVRNEAILRARDTGELAATGALTPLADNRDADVILAFLPLYKGGSIPATVEGRRQDFVGVVFVALEPKRLMQAAFRDLDRPPSHIRLFFGGPAEGGAPRHGGQHCF